MRTQDSLDIVSKYKSGLSIMQIAMLTGVAPSTVRHQIARTGELRSRTEGVRLASEQGRLGAGMRGKKRTFTEKHKKNISQARKQAAEKTAKGVSLKPSGYFEVTRGKHKGRALHRVVAESLIGRQLMKDEVVHHVDGNRTNNSQENLCVMTRAKHSSHHAKELHHSRTRDNKGRFA